MGVVMCFSRSSSSFTVSITLKPCRAQDGHETMFTPRWRRLSDFRISKPTRTSSTGSAESETRIVSPMPLHRSMPMPIDDFTVPEIMPPASVMPRCSGQSMASARPDRRPPRGTTSEAFTEILNSWKSLSSKNLCVIERALDHRFGARLAVSLQQFLFQRTGIDADAHGAAVILRGLHDVLHALRANRYCRD